MRRPTGNHSTTSTTKSQSTPASSAPAPPHFALTATAAAAGTATSHSSRSHLAICPKNRASLCSWNGALILPFLFFVLLLLPWLDLRSRIVKIVAGYTDTTGNLILATRTPITTCFGRSTARLCTGMHHQSPAKNDFITFSNHMCHQFPIISLPPHSSRKPPKPCCNIGVCLNARAGTTSLEYASS
jgi:hypothetical protein